METTQPNISQTEIKTYKFSWLYFALLTIAVIALYFLFEEALIHAVGKWDSPEYSHAYLIPLISLFIVWQKHAQIIKEPFPGSWLGSGIVLLGLFLWFLGEVSTLFIIIKYALLVVLFGLALSFSGIKQMHFYFISVALLFFTIPLPSFIYNNLSSYLQLISSKIGVEVIRLFGISVFLEGNVIDLGNYKLQVVEACSGLRYLFPLVTLGVIVAYFYQDSFWKKCVVVASTLPITIFMNSLRIGIIGVLVEYWGIEMAEGFLHDFEGWVVFMFCFAILLLEMWLLTKLTTGKSLGDVLSIDIPGKLDLTGHKIITRDIPKSFYFSVSVIILMLIGNILLPERQEAIPERKNFSQFPINIGAWDSQRKAMELKYINALKFEDYLLSNFISDKGALEFYIAYYDSQRKGESAHSPRSCLPGAGWRIVDRKPVLINYKEDDNDKEINVSRMLVQQGDSKYLMYYWFKQRDRHITNEYLVKWYLFWDGITRNRTDGALIRVMYPVPKGIDVNEADTIIQSFLRDALPLLPDYVPD